MTAKEWLKAYEERNGTITIDTMFEEAVKLIRGIEGLEERCNIFQNDNALYCETIAKMEIERNKAVEEAKKLRNEMDFYKGQIKAYQDCMNYRKSEV